MVILSAYTVETMPRGFGICSWPANSAKEAEALAKNLSVELADSPTYPNAFWVIGTKPIVKYYQGQRFDNRQTI